MQRNRIKQQTSFKARLLGQAKRLVEEAERLPIPDSDALLFKARHCEATAELSDWLSLPTNKRRNSCLTWRPCGPAGAQLFPLPLL
jgi:hypothetical protein